jgi:cytosine/adenosine deaminase-related metal-dependent hydrolase
MRFLLTLDYIDRFGFLGPRLPLGHGVWLNEADLDRVAATGTHICQNCSSNFRLRSGVAPLNAFEKRGIDTAIGLDEAGINDDRDMLQEMRMVLRAHRAPGMEDEDVPNPGQVLRMATTGGAATTPYGSHIGTIAVGNAADLVLLDWDKLAYPYLDPETPVLDAVLQRAKSEAVDLVMVAGEVVYEAAASLASTATRHCASCRHHCSMRSLTMRSNGGHCQRRFSLMSGASTPAISTPTPTCPTTARVPGFEMPDRCAAARSVPLCLS